MVCDQRARSRRWKSVDGSSARSDGLRFAVDPILPVRIDRSERSRTSLYDDAESRASLHELALRRGRSSATAAWSISIAERLCRFPFAVESTRRPDCSADSALRRSLRTSDSSDRWAESSSVAGAERISLSRRIRVRFVRAHPRRPASVSTVLRNRTASGPEDAKGGNS